MSRAIVLVHGGAGTAAASLHEAAVQGTREAADLAWKTLATGADAQRAAVAAVRALEDDPTFNAGRGACMNERGIIETDAGIMRSSDLRAGAVASVTELRDPISVAQAIMEEGRHIVLAGKGAEEFARARGLGRFGRDEVWTRKAQERHDAARSGTMGADNRADTVGAVVMDEAGLLVAAGSTGGVLLKSPGRVGDTPQVGSGFYAHPRLGAAAATGVGEAIIRHVMCYALLRDIADGAEPQPAAEALCRRVADEEGAAVGIIVVLPDGRFAVAQAAEHMSWAVVHATSPTDGGAAAQPERGGGLRWDGQDR